MTSDLNSLQNFRRAPGPRGNPVLGSLLEFQKDALGFLSEAVADHGDIVRMRFAHVQTHLINRPDLIEHVLLRSADDFDKKTRSVAKIKSTCGESLLSANEVAWARHRKLIQPVFLPKYLESAGPTIDAAMVEVLDRWIEAAERNEPIDIVAEMMHLVISVSARILFASDVNSELIEAALEIILADTWRRLQSPIDFSDLSPSFHRPAFKKAVKQVDQIVFDIIRNRRKSHADYNDVLSRLLVAHEAEDETGLSDQELRDAGVTLLLAGHETTANALAWSFILTSMSHGMGPEKVNLPNVFSETVRMYPSIWIIERRVKQDMQLDSYRLKKGSSVLVSPYLLHRKEEYWPNAETFDPSRFEAESDKSRPRNAYLPFGLGKHSCVGQHMARLIAVKVMENVFQSFRLHLVPDQNLRPDPGITLRHSGKVFMKVQKK